MRAGAGVSTAGADAVPAAEHRHAARQVRPAHEECGGAIASSGPGHRNPPASVLGTTHAMSTSAGRGPVNRFDVSGGGERSRRSRAAGAPGRASGRHRGDGVARGTGGRSTGRLDEASQTESGPGAHPVRQRRSVGRSGTATPEAISKCRVEQCVARTRRGKWHPPARRTQRSARDVLRRQSRRARSRR
jgi:hypothetical protein